MFKISPLEPIDPVLESPLSHPLLKQRAVAAELVNEVSVYLIIFQNLTNILNSTDLLNGSASIKSFIYISNDDK